MGSQTGAVGFLNGHSCQNRCQWVFEGVQLSKQGQLSFGMGSVVKKAWVGFRNSAGSCLAGDWWCQHGRQDGRGRGDTNVATDVVEVKDNGRGGADVATDVVEVKDDGRGEG